MAISQQRESVIRSSVPVFYAQELPGRGTAYGLLRYKGVLVCWDEDYDPRVLELVDAMEIELESWEWSQLIAVAEAEGTVGYLWGYSIPHKRAVGAFVDVAGDIWSTTSTTTRA